MDHSFSELDFQNNPLVHYSDGYFEFLKLVLPNSKFDKILLLENGEKKGFFNYVTHHNDAYGTVLNSLPFFGSHGGPIASNNFFKEKLIEKIKLNLSEINLASCTIIESPFYPLTNRDIQELGVSEVDYRIGQFTLLPADMPNFHVKTRNSIRKGQKLKMIIQKRNDHESWEWMRCVHESSILSLNGIPKSKSVFDSLKSALNKSVDLWVGSIENKPVCGLVTISYNQTVEYFTPVVETNFRDSQALSALIYEQPRSFRKVASHALK